jgi:serine/threonine protein phosphatase 1
MSNAGRTLVLGDVHGAYRALEQVLSASRFQAGVDRLIFLGDVCDGWPNIGACISMLMSVEAECVWGNHDEWAWAWMSRPGVPLDRSWLRQGGEATLRDLGPDARDAERKYGAYFRGLQDYIYDEARNYLFVHGGIPLDATLSNMPPRDELVWDRDLFLAVHQARRYGHDVKLTMFDKVFIGHTHTGLFSDVPFEACGVVMMDQGAGWDGRLSLMDVDTGEYWQSEEVQVLYPEEPGRSFFSQGKAAAG